MKKVRFTERKHFHNQFTLTLVAVNIRLSEVLHNQYIFILMSGFDIFCGLNPIQQNKHCFPHSYIAATKITLENFTTTMTFIPTTLVTNLLPVWRLLALQIFSLKQNERCYPANRAGLPSCENY